MGASGGGDQARANEQMAQDRARLAFLQSGSLQDDAALNVQNISRVLQEYDRTSGQAMGMTALQLARSGNMSRTSRSLNLDRSMGVNVDTPQEVLAKRLSEETGALAELERQKAAHEAVIGVDVEAMRTRLNELTSMTPTAPPPPSESDFRGTDREAYKRDLAAWEECEQEVADDWVDPRDKDTLLDKFTNPDDGVLGTPSQTRPDDKLEVTDDMRERTRDPNADLVQ